MARKKLTKKQKRNRLYGLIALILIIIGFAAGYFFGIAKDSNTSFSDTAQHFIQKIEEKFREQPEQSNGPAPVNSPVQIHLLDVGQGQAILLQAQDNTNILIDTGPYNDSDRKILQYLDYYIGAGGTLDLVILTHNDSDHIGFFDVILEYYNVEEVWMNGIDSASQIYEDVLDALGASTANYKEPKAGHVSELGPFLIEVLWPHPAFDSADQNENSIVTRISVNGLALLQTGDIGMETENQMLAYFPEIPATFQVMGHHGSKYSTGYPLIEAVRPEIALYSASENNQYGHPHQESLNRLGEYGIPIYGTAETGNITINIDESGNYTLIQEEEKEKDERYDSAA
jgi:beta-lactamase superfamily II metal-dependent hydrolase